VSRTYKGYRGKRKTDFAGPTIAVRNCQAECPFSYEEGGDFFLFLVGEGALPPIVPLGIVIGCETAAYQAPDRRQNAGNEMAMKHSREP